MNEKSQAERNAEIANAAVRSAANKVEAAKGADCVLLTWPPRKERTRGSGPSSCARWRLAS